MQAARKAVETLKETAANIGASAKSGLEKTKATVQEKNERMSARDLVQKDMATEKKEERINQAEMEKQEAREQNAVVKESATGGHVTEGHYTATTTGPGTETANQMPAKDGHGHGLGPGLAHDQLIDDMAGSHPTGTNTAMGANQMPAHGPGTGLEHDLFVENVAGSNPTTGTNAGMDSTAAHNVHAVGGPGPRSGPSLI